MPRLPRLPKSHSGDEPFLHPFRDMPGIPAAKQASLRAQAVQTIAERVQPAYAELLAFMRTGYVPGMRTTLAAIDLPDAAAITAPRSASSPRSTWIRRRFTASV